jgi:hypothetical protein
VFVQVSTAARYVRLAGTRPKDFVSALEGILRISAPTGQFAQSPSKIMKQ